MIDGKALTCLTERALELLIPPIGRRMVFLKMLDELKSNSNQVIQTKPLEAPTAIIVEELDDPDHQCTAAAAMKDQQQHESPTPVAEKSRLVCTFILV